MLLLCRNKYMTLSLKLKFTLQNVENEQLKAEITKLELTKAELQSKYDTLLSNTTHYTTDNSSSQFENNSTKSESPENFEVIDKLDRQDSPKSKSHGSIVTLDDDGSATSLNENDADWTRVALPLDNCEQRNVDTDRNSNSSKLNNSKDDIITLPKSQSCR